MIEWLDRIEASLEKALDIAERGDVMQENLYMIAPILYSEEMHTNDEAMFQKMCEVNERNVQGEWSLDPASKFQYKFHYVSSYLYCFVIRGKMDEKTYDRIMEYVTLRMDLFTHDYGIE